MTQGPFKPWIEHELQQGVCLFCQKAIPENQRHLEHPNLAYTHYDWYLRKTPTGRIVKCAHAKQEER